MIKKLTIREICPDCHPTAAAGGVLRHTQETNGVRCKTRDLHFLFLRIDNLIHTYNAFQKSFMGNLKPSSVTFYRLLITQLELAEATCYMRMLYCSSLEKNTLILT